MLDIEYQSGRPVITSHEGTLVASFDGMHSNSEADMIARQFVSACPLYNSLKEVLSAWGKSSGIDPINPPIEVRRALNLIQQIEEIGQ